MKVREILESLEHFAPLPLQDSFDNAGLQVGVTEVEATGTLLCLDVTEAVVDEAISLGFNLIISHHPLIFKSCKSITGKDYIGRCIFKAIKNDIVIYSAHTNLDNVVKGVNAKMAEKIGLKNIRILSARNDALLKLVVYVPSEYVGSVREALFAAGCGCIGQYDSCSYSCEGKGTFRPLEGTRPFCGVIGKLHTASEVRVETILPAHCKADVLQVLLDNHPYEEPAFDFYPVRNDWSQVGAGVVGELEKPMECRDFLWKVKQTFGVECIRHNGFNDRKIATVALCGGAGAFLIPQALHGKADAFVTGEIKYHEYFGYENDILLVQAGHYESERYTIELFSEVLGKSFPGLRIRQTECNTNPIKYLY